MSRFLLIPLMVGVLSACSTVLPERSIGRSFDDTNASVAIKSQMLRVEGFALDGVDVEVTEGIALLTGRVPRDDAPASARARPETGRNGETSRKNGDDGPSTHSPPE